MAYAIERDERLSAAIRRVLGERIDRAAQHLADEQQSEEERVHGARKRFKESRAVYRMIRYAFADFDGANAWFRDAGRDLASIRDAQALVEAMNRFPERAADRYDRKAIARVTSLLEKRRDDSAAGDLHARIANVLAQIGVARTRAETLDLPDDFSTIGRGLQRTFRDGRRAMRAALDERTAVSFHEWRKRVKDHWYHVQLLRHLWPDVLGPYEKEMEKLSDALGDHHDLDMLEQSLLNSPRYFGSGSVRRVLRLLNDQRAELEETAQSIGRYVYAEKPLQFRRRMAQYWKAWRPDPT